MFDPTAGRSPLGSLPASARYRRAEPGGGDEAELFRRLRESADGAAREQLIARHLPLAARLARRYSRAGESMDDLEQVAALGLVKAIDRFDSERHTSFISYAVPTILGEIKRHFRDRAWAVRVPRDLQELALRVDREGGALSRRLGRSPTVSELAASLGVSSEEVIEAQEAATAYRAVPLDVPSGDEEGDHERHDSSLGGDDPGYHLAEQRALLGSLMTHLDAREREVLRLRFVEDLTQSEIGERIGVSQMHVSRLIRQALARLQAAAD